VSNRKAESGESLTAQQYELSPFGVSCGIHRTESRSNANGEPQVVTAWTAHIDRRTAFSVTYDGDGKGDNGWGPVQQYVVLEASFPFDPAIDGDEADALERARAYCVDVAHEVAGIRPALEGLMQRVETVIKDAVRQHRAVPMKFH
jgi:hypothetical protein